MASPRWSSITLRNTTQARLRAYRIDGKSYDDVLVELMDRQPAEEFLLAHLRALRRAGSRAAPARAPRPRAPKA